MTNIQAKFAEGIITLEVNANSVIRNTEKSAIVAETGTFENIGNDGQYDYGLRMMVTKRPMKAVTDPAKTFVAPVLI